MRERNTPLYRLAHWPIWIGVFLIAPGPLTFHLFAEGFGPRNLQWLSVVLAGTGAAALRGRLPGVEPCPYILRFDEDKPNPLYRRVCYTFAWSAIVTYTLLNLGALLIANVTGSWYTEQIYRYAYLPFSGTVLALGAGGALPRVGRSTRGEGSERRYFYGSVWAALVAHPLLLTLWKADRPPFTGNLLKLGVFTGALVAMGLAAYRGLLPRTRPILAGDLMIAD